MKTVESISKDEQIHLLTRGLSRAKSERQRAFECIVEIGAELGMHPGDRFDGESVVEWMERFSKDIIKFIKAKEEA